MVPYFFQKNNKKALHLLTFIWQASLMLTVAKAQGYCQFVVFRAVHHLKMIAKKNHLSESKLK